MTSSTTSLGVDDGHTTTRARLPAPFSPSSLIADNVSISKHYRTPGYSRHHRDNIGYKPDYRRSSSEPDLPGPSRIRYWRTVVKSNRVACIGLSWAVCLAFVCLVYVSRGGPCGGWGLVSHVGGLDGTLLLDPEGWPDVYTGRGRLHRESRKGREEMIPGSKRRGKKQKIFKADKTKAQDGLYRFNLSSVAPKTPHPITILIEKSQEEWEAKNRRQSRTLEQAVKEYKRRYGIPPPRGFEKWWQYVNLDRIVYPFQTSTTKFPEISTFSFPILPQALAERMHTTARLPSTFILRNTAGSISVTRNFDSTIHRGAESRLKAQMEKLEPVSSYIGDFEAVWSVDDTPRVSTSFSHRRKLEEAANQGIHIDAEEDAMHGETGWGALCSTSTKFHRSSSHTDSNSKVFISSHPQSLSICANPTHVPIHGLTSGPYHVPQTSGHLPLFSLSRSSAHSDILGIPYFHAVNRPPLSWAEKTKARLLWRGGLTGAHFDSRVDWRNTQRFRLVGFANRTGVLSFLGPPTAPLRTQSTTFARAADRYLDVSATGGPIQCDKPTCDIISQSYPFASHMSHKDAAAYKYVLDVDGNAWSARFRGLLSTGSVILKSTIIPEWWTDRIQAWVHYIPVGIDYGELMDIMAYFTGDLEGKGGNDDAARQIAVAGQNWAHTHWRDEDMIAYTFRLYLEWARVWAGAGQREGYVYDASDESI